MNRQANLVRDPTLANYQAWTTISISGGVANFTFNQPGVFIAISNGGSSNWHVSLSQANISISNTLLYRFRVNARTETGLSRTVGNSIVTPIITVTNHYQT